MRKLVGLLVSLALLALIWWQVDLDAIAAATRAADPAWLVAGLATVVPLTLATAWRFRMLAGRGDSPPRLRGGAGGGSSAVGEKEGPPPAPPANAGGELGLGASSRLILTASTLNLVLPSKMGDLAKAYVLTQRYGFDGQLAVALVVMEKMLDMAALLAWGVLALLWVGAGEPLLLLAGLAVAALLLLLLVLLSPGLLAVRLMALAGRMLPGAAGRWVSGFAAQWHDAIGWFWRRRGRVAGVAAMSLAIWAGHLLQFWLFAQALAAVPLLDNMAFATLAILAGLLPFTMAGVGTRDVAIVFLYRDFLTPGQGAVLGVLATLRYLLPALAGLPWIGDYLDRRPRAREGGR